MFKALLCRPLVSCSPLYSCVSSSISLSIHLPLSPTFSSSYRKMSSGGWRPPQGYPAARRDEEAGFVYPSPSKGDVKIPEPYLWLEDPKGEETQEWVKKQVSLTSKFLEEKCDTRDAFRDTLKGLLNYPRVGVYSRHGDRYYFYRNSGLQNQSVLYRYNKPETYVGDHTEENTETILDANKMSEDGTVSVKHTVFSECGNYMAYSVAKSGSDWCEINVMDVKNEPTSLKDTLEWVRYSGLTWNNAGNSLLYSRYPAPKLSSEDGGDMTPGEEVDQSQNQRLYYHRLGTDQSEDVLIAEDSQNPHYMFSCAVSNDGERLLVHTSRDCNPEHLLSVSTNFKDFEAGKVDSVQLTPVVDDWIGSFSYLHSFGDFFLFMSNCKAEKYRIVGIDVNDPAPEKWVEVIPEHSEDVLNSALYVKGALVCVYMHNAMERIEVFPLNEEWVNKKGKIENSWDVELPGPGGISGLEGSHKRSEFFFSFLSFTDPGSIWRASAEDRSSTRVFATQLGKDAPDLDACGTRQIWYESSDQTKVPMFVIGKKDNLEKFDLPANDTKLPVQLYGYGGFNISLTPGFSVSRLIWITHLGGLIVVPNLRGGGEFGKGWHEAGQKEKKQNVFDDFIYAAKYLIDKGITTPEQIAINGGSNGGLLIATCMNQEPSLFGAGVAQVPVTDMLRFHKFTIGHAWTSDYGCSEEGGFDYLIEYSPLHNVKKVKYPSVLVTTADHDDRVVPLHSYKYVAELQHIAGEVDNQNPLLIRIDQKAGHGAGKPIAKTIEESADVWGFIAHALGCKWNK